MDDGTPEVEIALVITQPLTWEDNTASPAPKLVFLVCGKKSHRDKTQDLKVPGIWEQGTFPARGMARSEGGKPRLLPSRPMG